MSRLLESLNVKCVLFMLLFCLVASGQEAYVVQLSGADADHARATYNRLQQAQKDWQQEQDAIALRYLVVEPTDPDAGSQHYVSDLFTSGPYTTTSGSIVISGSSSSAAKEQQEQHARYDREKRQRRGFESCCSNTLPGFEFSKDFKFIVPRKPAPSPPPCTLIQPARW